VLAELRLCGFIDLTGQQSTLRVEAFDLGSEHAGAGRIIREEKLHGRVCIAQSAERVEAWCKGKPNGVLGQRFKTGTG
jgi:hypothetical protein